MLFCCTEVFDELETWGFGRGFDTFCRGCKQFRFGG